MRTRSKPLSHSPRPLQTKKKMKTQLNFDEMSVALFAKWQASGHHALVAYELHTNAEGSAISSQIVIGAVNTDGVLEVWAQLGRSAS